jgi:predicted Holliday junction resolvase-like endonuclease
MTSALYSIAVALFILISLLGFSMLYFFRAIEKLKGKNTTDLSKLPAPQVVVNLQPLEEAIRSIPTKVLQSIQSSTNTKKGVLGELIGYIQLEAEYDRIIPLGNIVDFMCIKFPKQLPDGIIDLGQVDFVDIKTGKSSRLSKDQRELQNLIKEKRINFVKLKVDTQTSASKPQSD